MNELFRSLDVVLSLEKIKFPHEHKSKTAFGRIDTVTFQRLYLRRRRKRKRRKGGHLSPNQKYSSSNQRNTNL